MLIVIGGYLMSKNSNDPTTHGRPTGPFGALVVPAAPQSAPPPAQDSQQQSMPAINSSNAPHQKSFTITGQNFSFAPSTITVKKGDRVKIIFKNAGGFHDFQIDEFKIATKQIRGGAEEAVSFVADQAGSFEYYCSVGTHRAMGMHGTLVVE